MSYLTWASSRFVVASVGRAILISWGSSMVDRVPVSTSPALVTAVVASLPYLVPSDAIITAAVCLLHDTVVKPACAAEFKLLQRSCG